MSNLKTVSKDFAADFAIWETRLKVEGYSPEAVEEIKQAIRNDWDNEELRELWIAQVKKEADFMRGIQAMAKGITNRIKEKQ